MIAVLRRWFRPAWCSCGHPSSGHSPVPPNPCQVCSCTEFSY